MDTEFLHTLQLGNATVTVINVGNLRGAFTEDGQEIEIPVQSVLIQLPDVTVLVDASLYEIPDDSPYAIPGYQPPPGLLSRLTEMGIQRERIAYVIITHPHFDHINGLTEQSDGGYVPCFPNARHYLGRADWEDPDTQKELQNPDSLASRTLGVLMREGLFELVSERRDLTNELQIIPSPGESPGHQIVRVHSQGETLYVLGDLYHDEHEVRQPDHVAWWVNLDIMLKSRNALAKAALEENAYLTAAHLPGFGRLARTENGVEWQSD
jgi:glyoxylase-like metal-dependent hydrolase (beta-lactamase superfamily II)